MDLTAAPAAAFGGWERARRSNTSCACPFPDLHRPRSRAPTDNELGGWRLGPTGHCNCASDRALRHWDRAPLGHTACDQIHWATISDYGDVDSVAVNFAFEADRADEVNEIEEPCLGRTAVVTRDALTTVDQEGGFLLVLTPSEGGDTMEVAGLDGIEVEWDRSWAIEVANGPKPTFWREETDDEAKAGGDDNARSVDN